MKEEIYYAIDSGNGYGRGLNVDRSLSLGGRNVIKNMSGNYAVSYTHLVNPFS